MTKYSKGKNNRSRDRIPIPSKKKKKPAKITEKVRPGKLNRKSDPLAETIFDETPVGLIDEKQGDSFFKFSDEGIVRFAQRYVDLWELRSLYDLEVRYYGMYVMLERRNLLDKIKFKK